MSRKLNKHKVAIFMATYNGIRFIREQLATIKGQVDIQTTVIIGDDYSDDGTWEYLNELNDPDIILLTRKKCGSAARNFFRILCDFDFSDFDFVAFSDQDDLWQPLKLISAINRMRFHNCVGYSSNLIALDMNAGKTWILKKDQPQRDFDYLFQGASAGCTYILDVASALLIKKKMSGFYMNLSTKFSHDWIIYAICRSYKKEWYFDNDAHLLYRQHDSNVHGALPGIKGLFAKIKSSRTGWYRQQIIWLENVIAGNLQEIEILGRVKSLSIFDRIWLAHRTSKFRRLQKDQFLLAISLLSGHFK